MAYIFAAECIFVSSTTFTQSAPKATEFGENYAAVRAITPFKVTEFGTNQKRICDFLLVINSNVPPILHRF